jgi:hypothetical protein
VQASFSQLDGIFFFIETIIGCGVLLQILLSAPAYLYTTDKVL